MVTCPYRGIAANTLGSKLESIGISTDFIAGVLVARQIENGIHFALGSTLAMSRTALDAIGGLRPLVDYLADDFELGFRIANAGYEVVLADVVVETHLPAYNFRGFLATNCAGRAACVIPAARVTLDCFLPSAFPGPSLPCCWRRSVGGHGQRLLLAAALRAAVAIKIGIGVVHDRALWRRLWLLPLRDLVALWIWFASFASNKVHWRGEVFLLKNGKITPAHPRSPEFPGAAKSDPGNVSAHL